MILFIECLIDFKIAHFARFAVWSEQILKNLVRNFHFIRVLSKSKFLKIFLYRYYFFISAHFNRDGKTGTCAWIQIASTDIYNNWSCSMISVNFKTRFGDRSFSSKQSIIIKSSWILVKQRYVFVLTFIWSIVLSEHKPPFYFFFRYLIGPVFSRIIKRIAQSTINSRWNGL